jgi:hypothetical protein
MARNRKIVRKRSLSMWRGIWSRLKLKTDADVSTDVGIEVGLHDIYEICLGDNIHNSVAAVQASAIYGNNETEANRSQPHAASSNLYQPANTTQRNVNET